MLDLEQNNYSLRNLISEDVFTPEECETLIKMDLPYTTIENYQDYTKARRKFIPVEPEYEWISIRLIQRLQQINDFFYKFDLARIVGASIMDYLVDDFVDWHIDMGSDFLSTRKLTSVTLLSNAADFDGGDLEWFPPFPKQELSQGSMLVFPSFIAHRVTPLTRGIRTTLVAWAHGPAFR